MMGIERAKTARWSRLAPWLPILLAAIVYLLSTTGRGVIDYDEAHNDMHPQPMTEAGA